MEEIKSKSEAKRIATQKGEELKEFIRCYSCGLVRPIDEMERVKIVGLITPRYLCKKCRAEEPK